MAYVDVLDGAISGYIRCEDKDSARKLANSASTEYSFTLVSGKSFITFNYLLAHLIILVYNRK